MVFNNILHIFLAAVVFQSSVYGFVCPVTRTGACRSAFVAKSGFINLGSDKKTTLIGSTETPQTEAVDENAESTETEEAKAEEETAPTETETVDEVEEQETESKEESAGDDEPTERKVTVTRERHTIFLGNLPFETTDSEVLEMFSAHGTVELVSIPRNKESGQSRGFAFVDMSSPAEVQQAIDALAGTMYGGRTLRVQASLDKEAASQQAKKLDDGAKKIYVGNLSFDATRDDVLEMYSSYGVRDVYVPLNRKTGGPRGFAFVTLEQDNVDRAIEETDGMEFMGRSLSVSVPLPPGERPARRDPRSKLYVGNLSFYTVPDTLRELFEEFGTVYDCYMPEDPETGGSRGFGFVTLDKEAAANAVNETDGCELDGRIIRVNEAQPKGARRNDDEDKEEEQENFDE